MGKVYGRVGHHLAADAVRLAVADAGLTLVDVDGLLISSGTKQGVGHRSSPTCWPPAARVCATVNAYGATAGDHGRDGSARDRRGRRPPTVACVFADAPLKPKEQRRGLRGAAAASRREISGHAGRSTRRRRRSTRTSSTRWPPVGTWQRVRHHQRAARRDRGRAAGLGRAQPAGRRCATPMTIDDHQASRWIAEPFHLLDCCLVSNGGVAVIVTAGDRAPRPRQARPSTCWGWGQGTRATHARAASTAGLVTGAASRPGGAADGRHRRRRRRHRRALRLLHLHRRWSRWRTTASAPRAKAARSSKTASSGRAASLPHQHRRRRAIAVLHVGHDAAVRRRHPGPRRGRRPPGADATTSSWSAATAASSTTTRR